MKKFCCCLASTHLFLRIQHVLLFVIINVHCTFKLNGATVTCKSFKNFHVLQVTTSQLLIQWWSFSECSTNIATCLCEKFEILEVHDS